MTATEMNFASGGGDITDGIVENHTVSDGTSSTLKIKTKCSDISKVKSIQILGVSSETYHWWNYGMSKLVRLVPPTNTGLFNFDVTIANGEMTMYSSSNVFSQGYTYNIMVVYDK